MVQKKNKLKRTLRLYLIFLGIWACIVMFLYVGGFMNTNSQKPNATQEKPVENKTNSSIVVVTCSPLDSLLNEKQKLQDSLLMEVTGKISGKAGYGIKAKAIQQEIEKIQLQIDAIQKVMEVVEIKVDTTPN